MEKDYLQLAYSTPLSLSSSIFFFFLSLFFLFFLMYLFLHSVIEGTPSTLDCPKISLLHQRARWVLLGCCVRHISPLLLPSPPPSSFPHSLIPPPLLACSSLMLHIYGLAELGYFENSLLRNPLVPAENLQSTKIYLPTIEETVCPSLSFLLSPFFSFLSFLFIFLSYARDPLL